MLKNDENKQLDYIGYLEQGQYYQQQGQEERKKGALARCKEALKRAEECFSNAIELNSSDFRAYLQRGALYQEQWDFELALDDFNQAINCNPKNSVAYLKRGDIYQAQGKLELALEDYNYVLDNLVLHENFRAQFLLSRGRVFQKQKDFNLAQKDFTQAIILKKALNKDCSEAYWCLGILYMEKQDFPTAQEYFEQAIKHADNPAMLRKFITIEAHFYHLAANHFDLARKYIETAFFEYGFGESLIEIQNKERYLNHIKMYEENIKLREDIKLKNQMQKMVRQYTHTLGNTIFPGNILEVAKKLRDFADFKKESLLLYNAYDAEVFILHQSELLRQRHIAQNPEEFRDFIRQDISLSDKKPVTNIEQILNDALKRVISRFLDENYAKFNEIRQWVLAERGFSLLELRQNFEEQIFFKNQSSLHWVHNNLFTIKVDFSTNWQSIKLKENGFAEALLQGYFYELFFNIFKYSDYQGIKLQFDEQEIDGCAYLISKWKNSYVDNTQLGTGKGLENIQEDLRQLHDSKNEAITLQRSNHSDTKIFQVILPLRKDLLICETFKKFTLIQ